MSRPASTIIVGGGFFGCVLAERRARQGQEVLLLEAESDLLTRASLNNQARIHNGYHYPRAYRTALRSHLHFQRFLTDYQECVEDRFTKVYAIARQFSKVTARSFWNFCRQIGAPIAEAPAAICRLFNSETVEAVFTVTEWAFDAVKLRQLLRQRLQQADVTIQTKTTVERVAKADADLLRVEARQQGETVEYQAGEVFNCTYANLNRILQASRLPLIPLKHEWTEMALLEVPEELHDKGITVMCGPFFSTMPFPSRSLHTLSHVRYTPHQTWTAGTAAEPAGLPVLADLPRVTAVDRMQRHAALFVPALAGAHYVDSLWEIKTILPRNEADDGRPVLYRRDHGLPGLHCVLGAKIDNVYDLLAEVDENAKASAVREVQVA